MADKPTVRERFAEWLVSHFLWSITGEKLVEWLRGALVSGVITTVLSLLINRFRPIALPLLVVVSAAIFVGVMIAWERALHRQRRPTNGDGRTPPPRLDLALSTVRK